MTRTRESGFYLGMGSITWPERQRCFTQAVEIQDWLIFWDEGFSGFSNDGVTRSDVADTIEFFNVFETQMAQIATDATRLHQRAKDTKAGLATWCGPRDHARHPPVGLSGLQGIG